MLRIDDTADVAGTLVGVGIAVGFFWRHRRGSTIESVQSARTRWAPVLLGGGLLFYAGGSVLWYVYQIVLKQPPFPSWADAFYLVEDPLLLCGILLLPLRPLAGVARTRIVLDGLMIMTAVVTTSWYFVLGPTIQQAGETLLAKAVGTAYPLSDLVLILCVVMLWSRAHDPALRPTVLLISAALAMIVVADTIFDYQGLHGGAPAPSMVDPMWSVAALLIGFGAREIRKTRGLRTDVDADEKRADDFAYPSLRHSLLPYAFLPVVAGLVLYVLTLPTETGVVRGVYIGGVAMVGLVIVRQVVALMENQRLYGRVSTANTALEVANTALAGVNQTLHDLATTDPITAVPNHRAIEGALNAEVERARRYNHCCSVLFLDIDHFKTLNDTYGHSVGDSALRTFASVVASSLRSGDTLGRWGGEEFVAVLVEADAAAAVAVAERVRAAVAACRVDGDERVLLTCSIGVAMYPDDGSTTDELVSAADHGMYAAKVLGRNRVFQARDAATATIAQMSASPGRA
jgi:diguanylate cyclase (GGDEF)-like protein